MNDDFIYVKPLFSGVALRDLTGNFLRWKTGNIQVEEWPIFLRGKFWFKVRHKDQYLLAEVVYIIEEAPI